DRLMNKILFASASKILSNSKAALDYFYPENIRQNPNSFEVIYNGVDYSSFLSSQANLRAELGIPEQAFVIGHIGRVAPAKNHTTILDVAIKMVEEDPNVYFLLCGDKTIECFNSTIN